MSVQKHDRAAAVMARYRTTPVRIVSADPTGIGGVIARVMQDPAAGLFRRSVSDALEWIDGILWLAAAVADIGNS